MTFDFALIIFSSLKTFDKRIYLVYYVNGNHYQ